VPIRWSRTAERQFSWQSGNGRAQLFAELACGRWRWPTACLKRRRARPNQLTFAPLSKAPYVHTLHGRPHQHACRMIEPVRACVRARACMLCTVRCALHVHVPYTWCSLLVAAGARLPADQCCSQRCRLTPRFAQPVHRPQAQAQCAGAVGAAPVTGAAALVHHPAPGLPVLPRGVPRRGRCCGIFSSL
jgi:hypothetical protein